MGTDLANGRPGGFGVIDRSSLYRNGRDCENGIPGAAVYTAGNRAGGRILDSKLYDNCGNNLDMVDSERFHIEGNDIYNPGYPVPNAVYYCTGTASGAVVNIRESTFLRNTFRNTNTRTTARQHGDPNRFFSADGAAAYSDLPGGWSSSTTNYFRDNNPFGSNVGSRRGGGNWYAADTVCTAASSPPPCNVDDHQHPTSVNWARNDGFYFY